MIGSATDSNQANFSSEILHEPKKSHFCEAKKSLTGTVFLTIRGVTFYTQEKFLYIRYLPGWSAILFDTTTACYFIAMLVSYSLTCSQTLAAMLNIPYQLTLIRIWINSSFKHRFTKD